MDSELLMPGAVEVSLGEYRLIPGPKGDTGERGPRGYGIESAVLNPDFTLTLKFEDGTSYTTPALRGADGTGVREARLEAGEYGGGGYSDKLVVELTDGRLFSFEIFNRAAEFYDKAESARTAAEAARDGSETARDESEAAAGRAAQSEAAASSSQGAAAESAREAAEAKDAALTARGEAETSASAAAESAAAAAGDAESAKQYSGKPPVIDGESGSWKTWNAASGAYEDTGMPSRGEKGEQGPPGSGDMEASVYDTQGRATDVFRYVDEAAAGALKKEDPEFTGSLTSGTPMPGSNGLQISGEEGVLLFGGRWASALDGSTLHFIDMLNMSGAYIRLADDGTGTLLLSQEYDSQVDAALRGVAAPVKDSDAANKKYVDSRVLYGTAAPKALDNGVVFLVYE